MDKKCSCGKAQTSKDMKNGFIGFFREEGFEERMLWNCTCGNTLSLKTLLIPTKKSPFKVKRSRK